MAFTVLLDANVLYPQYLNDALLRFSAAGFYQARWSEQILEEASRNLKENRTEQQRQSIDKRFTTMKKAFPEAIVTGYEPLIPAMTNDKKDRHVLAAAITGRADLIVTSNLKDFPEEACAPYNIDVQPPDDFLCYQFDLEDPEQVMSILKHWASSLAHPPLSLEELLDVMARQTPDFAHMARQFHRNEAT